jgi:hypothetical protein
LRIALTVTERQIFTKRRKGFFSKFQKIKMNSEQWNSIKKIFAALRNLAALREKTEN